MKSQGIAPVIGDLADSSSIRDAVMRSAVIVNAADADDAHIVGNLLHVLEGTGKRFIHTSGSSIAVDDPENAGLWSRYWLEKGQPPDSAPRSQISRRGARAIHRGGKSIWSNVFLMDLLDLYARAIERAPSGTFFFAENADSSWMSTAELISFSLGFYGRVRSWALEEAISELRGVARFALATNCRVGATNARALLGWSPSGPSLEEMMRARN